ncbi:GFA family protein [Luteimonas salinilitoris]|uniref:GFA family protein n=1 Tax=Luteimonas salinilitoris TaxID=3237697 RepID=A0ABV4HT18_9GAMM
MLKGQCFCGAVRYEAGDTPSQETACHCSVCRHTSGAPFVAWFTVPAMAFRFTSGRPASFRSSAHGTRMFCAACGTPLTFRSAQFPDEIDVTTCSLEDPERLPPKDHTHTSSGLSWVRLADGLPVYGETRSGIGAAGPVR